MVDQIVPDNNIYDIRKAELQIIHYYGSAVSNVSPKVDGVGEDGYGITPSIEVSVIKGLTQEWGFNMDPMTMAEAMVSLKSVSLWNGYLQQMWNLQQVTPKSFIFQITVDAGFREAFGFSRKVLPKAMIVGPPEHTTDGKESPQYEWKFVGYGYQEYSANDPQVPTSFT